MNKIIFKLSIAFCILFQFIGTDASAQTSNGTCSAPNLANDNGADFDGFFWGIECANMLDFSGGKVTTYWIVKSSSTGTLGVAQQIQTPTMCNYLLATRKAYLYDNNQNCSGTPIAPTTALGPNSSTLNPEWNGLLPDHDYVIKIEMDIDATCDDAMITEICVNRYDNISTPPPGCSADAGTFTIKKNGVLITTFEVDVAKNETLVITSNADYVLPTPAGPDPAGVGYAAFSCDPATLDLTDPNTFIDGAPCFLGFHFDSTYTDVNGAKPNASPLKTYWMIPITFDDYCSTDPTKKSAICKTGDQNIGVDVSQNGCFAIGTPIKINYVDATCRPIAIELYKDTDFNTVVTNKTFTCDNLDPVFLGPKDLSFFFDPANEPDFSWPFPSIIIDVTANTGTLKVANTVINVYDAATGAFIESYPIGDATNSKVFHFFAKAGGYTFSIDKTNQGSGSYDYTIYDAITKTVLASGTWSVTSGSESAQSAICKPKAGTGTFTCADCPAGTIIPGIGPNHLDEVGIATFDPKKAGNGTHTIVYTWSNGAGCNGKDSITVTVTGGGAPSLTGDTLILCGLTNPKIDTLNTIFGVSSPGLLWYDMALGGTLIPMGTLLDSGKTYYASQKSGTCESQTRDSVFVILKNPEMPVIANHLLSFCVVEYKKLSDIVIEGVNIKWYKQPVGGLELPGNTLLDSITYYASQTIGSCESDARDSVVIKLRDSNKPTLKDPNIAQPLVFCSFPKPKVGDLKIYVLGNNLKFYKDSILGTSINLNDTIKTGTYYVSQKPEGKCESAHRLSISVVLGDTTSPELNIDSLSFCPSENPTVANLLPNKTNLIWYDIVSDGIALPTTTPLENGKTYYAAQKGKICESASRDSVKVNLKSPEAPTGTAALSFCISNNATIANLSPNGADIFWFDAPNAGNLMANPDFLESGKTYYASKKTGNCLSTERLSVTVTIEDPKATISANSSTLVCKGKNATIEIDNPKPGVTYNIYSAFNAASPIATAPYTFTPTNDTIYYIQAVSASSCAQLKPGTPILIRVNPLPKSPNVISSIINACSKKTVVLEATSGQPNVSYSWTGPNNFKSTLQNPLLTASADSSFSGKYFVSVTDKNTGCTSAKSDSITLSINSLAAGFTSNITSGFIPLTIEFNNTSTNATKYYWNFKDDSSSTQKDPVHVYKKEGNYMAYLIASNGACTDTAYSILIDVKNASSVEIPNVFTPNNDGINDVFVVKSGGLKYFECHIFNRWGELIYEWTNINDGWNGISMAGVNVSDGVYFYIIKAMGNDGVLYKDQGPILLTR